MTVGQWIRERWKAVIVGRDGSPMLVRYRLLDTRWGALYIHHFLRSDQDRDLHDHPWHFTSLILVAGYWEEVPYAPWVPTWTESGRRQTMWVRRRPGRLVRHAATDAHRVLLSNGRPAWTLLWVSPRVREWGFHTKTGWVPWQEYVG